MSERLTLNNHYSQELDANYSAIYRSRDEMQRMIESSFVSDEYSIAEQGFLFPDALEKGKRQGSAFIFSIKRKDKMRTAYCFDLDGTLTRQELLPLIARSVDLEDEISVLTEATIAGLIPFEKSFKLRVRLLRDAKLAWIHHVLEHEVDFQPELLRFIQARPDQCFVITGNLDIWVKPLRNKLGIQSFTSVAQLDEKDSCKQYKPF